MHHVRFRDPAGAVRQGEWHEDAITFGGERYDHDEVDILPPCEPSKIVCIGRNYAEHAAEMDNDMPNRPLLFLKPPNTLAGHGDTVTLPADKERIDHEAELAVVIGEQCRHVDAEDAMDVVAGFTCLNDLSNRDDQNKEQNWVRGKAFDGSAPMGPVLADPEHVPDDAAVELRVNGDLRQEGSRDQLFFDVPTLIEEITTYLTLEPGDVISTGTPAGVGPLEDGDTVEVIVEGVGTLEHDVRIP
ncbi:2-keto-4-pentenoate hydratase/2-oxohepta-3-ene-1,7-dioic acid hydratase (catechol pathway) [Halogranum gelatinilyticum]|uniref:2-keto-4-pentenoate hydratase/2-oxohepta-3-ene-1,7-dioic acid hydratase (Catechol pathway) n=1 Tax=Halogranum gelatinilyticum TaxID=660521 RepID=A0A1H0A128_9EURY|nr:fumarylacetoacetate hydrolase family protein [Halogranum gelatinilyticum]SDN27419.1 2-keto-4-pentenoate hydratase/2-oxohepta-3-ene-1,7-dioic acid hydratase (catechol pathway) [Halogranum gelatinilyticum]